MDFKKTITIDSILLPRVTLSICSSNLAYLGFLDRISCQQWGGIKYLTNSKSSDVISRRGRIGRTVHQRQNGRVHATDTQGNGTSATTHSNPNQQFYRTHTTYQQNPPHIESHGYAIQLAKVPRCTGPISILLETRDTELIIADYWTKHHPASHHKLFCPQILTSPKDPEYQKLTTPQNTMSKSCVKNILKPPIFAEQIAAKQQTLAARSA